MRRRELIIGAGAAIIRPCAARSQQNALPIIGFLSSRSPEDSSAQMAGFRQGLAEMSFVEGENLAIEYRWARGDYERLPALAADLVGKPVRVLATVGGEPSALAAKAATSTIPIVFSTGNAVQAGLVESYNRPGGNITGIDIMSTEIEAKRIGLLHDLVPQATTIGFLVNPAYSPGEAQQRAVEEAAHALKLQVLILSANSDGEIEKAFETMVQQHIGALAIATAPFFDTRRAKFLALQSQDRLPTAYSFREYAAGGGLMSYGPNTVDAYRQVALYVGRILKGETWSAA
ncbi:MAG TPA: ABC transporter substrate-binding protein [Stellaceae bacterium]|nr:ABC transporter substrate-binding protein [Stellaceae bacterium]